MLRNFERFEAGHYYVYCGGKRISWNEKMEKVLDRRIYQCKFVMGGSLASFVDMFTRETERWNWTQGFDDWVEVESPDAIAEGGDSVLMIKSNGIILKVFLQDLKQFNIGDNNGVKYKDENIYYILKRKPKMDITKDRFEGNPNKRYYPSLGCKDNATADIPNKTIECFCPVCCVLHKFEPQGLFVKGIRFKCKGCDSTVYYDKDIGGLVHLRKNSTSDVNKNTEAKNILDDINEVSQKIWGERSSSIPSLPTIKLTLGIDQNNIDYFRQFRHIPKYKKLSDV